MMLLLYDNDKVNLTSRVTAKFVSAFLLKMGTKHCLRPYVIIDSIKKIDFRGKMDK